MMLPATKNVTFVGGPMNGKTYAVPEHIENITVETNPDGTPPTRLNPGAVKHVCPIRWDGTKWIAVWSKDDSENVSHPAWPADLKLSSRQVIQHKDTDDPEVVIKALLHMFQEVLNPLGLGFTVETAESVKSPLAVEIALTLTRVPPKG